MVKSSDNVFFVIHQMANGVLISDVISAIGRRVWPGPSSNFSYIDGHLAHSIAYSTRNLNIY